MKKQLTAWMLLLCFAALTAVADDKQEESETILGLWYVQVGGTEDDKMVFGPSFSMQMDFRKDGRVNMVMMADGEKEDEETQQYTHDKEKATLSIYEIDEDGQRDEDPVGVIQYAFVDGMLAFRFDEGDEEVTLELTRKPEGTERHQKMREEQGDTAGEAVQAARETARAMQSSTQMRGLHLGAVAYSNQRKNKYPDSLGEMLPLDFFTPEYVLTPWSETEVPKGFDDWADQKKIDWANTNSGYVYLLTGKQQAFDDKLVAIFELPRSTEQETVRLLFDDSRVEALDYAEADKLIKKQTNVSLKEWMKTTSPGTGELILREKQAEDGEG